jgi:predicted anti-sigma-YlaC factor YlaD
MKSHADMLETACKEFEADLVLYYYGDEFESEQKRVEEHLRGCLRCRRFLDDLRKLLPQMSQPKEFPQAFWTRYYEEMVEKINAHQEKKFWWRQFFTPMRLWLVPAFGTVAVAILAFTLVLGKGNSQVKTDRPVEKIPQEIMADVNQLEFFKSMDMLESLHLLESLDRSKTDAKTI